MASHSLFLVWFRMIKFIILHIFSLSSPIFIFLFLFSRPVPPCPVRRRFPIRPAYGPRPAPQAPQPAPNPGPVCGFRPLSFSALAYGHKAFPVFQPMPAGQGRPPAGGGFPRSGGSFPSPVSSGPAKAGAVKSFPFSARPFFEKNFSSARFRAGFSGWPNE